VVKRRDGSLVAAVLGDLVPELDVAAGEDAALGPPMTTLLSGSMSFADFISSAGSFPSPPTHRTTFLYISSARNDILPHLLLRSSPSCFEGGAGGRLPREVFRA
jgi:hypothetical protein